MDRTRLYLELLEKKINKYINGNKSIFEFQSIFKRKMYLISYVITLLFTATN